MDEWLGCLWHFSQMPLLLAPSMVPVIQLQCLSAPPASPLSPLPALLLPPETELKPRRQRAPCLARPQILNDFKSPSSLLLRGTAFHPASFTSPQRPCPPPHKGCPFPRLRGHLGQPPAAAPLLALVTQVLARGTRFPASLRRKKKESPSQGSLLLPTIRKLFFFY